jgi:hypothetical protein
MSSPFYSYPVSEIVRLLGVSAYTARRFKQHPERASTTVLRLFRLLTSGQVLGSEWDGWRVEGGCLYSPEGDRWTPADLRAARWYRAIHSDTQRTAGKVRQGVDSETTRHQAKTERAPFRLAPPKSARPSRDKKKH